MWRSTAIHEVTREEESADFLDVIEAVDMRDGQDCMTSIEVGGRDTIQN